MNECLSMAGIVFSVMFLSVGSIALSFFLWSTYKDKGGKK